MLNNINIIGRLTAKPELKKAGDTFVTNFSVAVDRNYKNKDGNRETDFFNVIAWKHTAEFICKQFDKGNYIAIVGEMNSRKYKGKDGSTKQVWEIQARDAYFCANKTDLDVELPF